MAKKNTVYSEQAITALKGADRVREKPSVIFGSDGIEGCQHAFFEILSNSIDEAREGYGQRIIVTAYNDKSIKVEDSGRGVPMDWNAKEGRYNWELVYCEMYAGGKYNNNDAGAAYGFSLGTNGLGACATQYASEFMNVTSYKNGTKYTKHFKSGEPVGDLEIEACPKTKTGTVVHWKPDIKVFNDINIPREYYQDVLKKQAVVNNGLELVLNWQLPDGSYDEYSVCYQNGIVDYVNEIVGDSAITETESFEAKRRGRDRADKPEYDVLLSVAFCFSNTVSTQQYFHNSSPLDYGGAPERAMHTAFVYAIDKYAGMTNKYNKNESKITSSDVDDSLVLVSSTFSTVTSYENQTKRAVTNKFICDSMTEWLKQSLQAYFAENPKSADKIADAVLINKRARESAASMRGNTKKKLTASLALNNTVEKFVNCRERDSSHCEIYIVEGDSALTSCKLARDAEFQALLPVRGKTLNCVKASYDRIMKSDIVLDLIKVLGCGVEIGPKGGVNKDFDIDSLRWNKIIICTDADDDGYQIRTLLLTVFYRLLPSLINNGKIYIAETPLYEIRTKDNIFFAYDEAEKAKILSELGDTKFNVLRSKGLGENEPDMMSRTTMKPATRRLIRIMPEDAAATARMFDLMLGDNLDGRKAYINQNGLNYIKDMDV